MQPARPEVFFWESEERELMFCNRGRCDEVYVKFFFTERKVFPLVFVPAQKISGYFNGGYLAIGD